MRKFLLFGVVFILLFSNACSAAWIYPPQSDSEYIAPEITERINIVFDNSGHENVKNILIESMIAASIAEHSEIWIYPIAGSNEPIRLETNQKFLEENFTKYTKSSNEFKTENIIDKALADLKVSPRQTKRLILYADNETAQQRNEYDVHSWTENYIADNPDIIFSTAYSFGAVMNSDIFWGQEKAANYEGFNGSFREFILMKNGYSPCEFTYEKEYGVIHLAKEKVNKNIFVFANNAGHTTYRNTTEVDLYLGGCAMGDENYNNYLAKSKVKGVALSYNHIVAEWERDDSVFATAVYTLDGVTVDPMKEGVCIPLLNAEDVEVYHKETPGSGLCSAKTSYDSGYDKKLVNYFAPEEEELEQQELPISIEQHLPKRKNSIVSIIMSLITGFISLVFTLLNIAAFVFVILLIVYPRFRSNVKLKIHESKFGPLYDKIESFIKRLWNELFGGAKKVKGITNLNGKYVFVSKKTEDMESGNSRASIVVRELNSRGIQCWLSEDGIDGGEDHNSVIPQAIKECAIVLVFVSTRSVMSLEVITEVEEAKTCRKMVIPVQIEDFDLFKEYSNWRFMLKPYKKLNLFSSKPEAIKEIVDQIQKKFDEI